MNTFLSELSEEEKIAINKMRELIMGIDSNVKEKVGDIITIVAEDIEFTIIKSVSDKSFETLQANQQEYLDIRNRTSLDVGLFTNNYSNRNLDWI